MHLFWTSAILGTLKHHDAGKLDTLNIKLHLWPLLMSPRSCQVMIGLQQSFVNIFFYNRDMLERWNHFRCVHVDDTDRLMYNMTSAGTGHDLDLRSRFEVVLFWSNFGSFNASQWEKNISSKFNAKQGWCQKLLAIKCPQNVQFYHAVFNIASFPDFRRSNGWPEVIIVVRCWKEI